ncbi:hypothetical protein C1I89_02905 [Achromobacter pulmonis]|uniref:Capsule polysaccharide biosynthesis protein n=1 Tax=Achromobacter pulmonis TaxID=1389932 RepID=A0A2N8KPI2_9BURK|nr:hypothetical protein [Achromobacter pulmonis]PND35349.1 hypothetical protein C1I89_02905 [Achromobacter pulmonis]
MIIFSDKSNFKRANFPALFDFLEGEGVEHTYDEANGDLKTAWGVYDFTTFGPTHRMVAESDQTLYRGIDISESVKDELYSKYALHPDWALSEKQSEEELYQFMQDRFSAEIRNCRAAACYWVDYWDSVFASVKPVAAITFGGNLIYSKIFLAVAKQRGVPGFVAEHFFTGNDFYLEPRYTSIPNASFLRSRRFTDAINGGKSQRYSSAWRKIYSQKNKNVSQPAYASYRLRGYALILAQVPNDFSIFSSNNKWKNSIGFYKKVISEILQCSKDPVVVKVHPYERKKNKDASVSTFDALKEYREMLDSTYRARLHIVEDYSLPGLISGCKYAITLNSQAGLEAVGHAKPLICFGGAFYGGRGFTMDLDDISDIGKAIESAEFSEKTLSGYVSFLSAAFSHLIGVGEAGKIKGIFGSLELKKRREAVTADPEIQVEQNIKAPNPDASSHDIVLKKLPVSARHVGTSGSHRKTKRLWEKFKRDPRGYCLDSKHAILRFIGRKVL